MGGSNDLKLPDLALSVCLSVLIPDTSSARCMGIAAFPFPLYLLSELSSDHRMGSEEKEMIALFT